MHKLSGDFKEFKLAQEVIYSIHFLGETYKTKIMPQ